MHIMHHSVTHKGPQRLNIQTMTVDDQTSGPDDIQLYPLISNDTFPGVGCYHVSQASHPVICVVPRKASRAFLSTVEAGKLGTVRVVFRLLGGCLADLWHAFQGIERNPEVFYAIDVGVCFSPGQSALFSTSQLPKVL